MDSSSSLKDKESLSFIIEESLFISDGFVPDSHPIKNINDNDSDTKIKIITLNFLIKVHILSIS
jgi:hypothetical protein